MARSRIRGHWGRGTRRTCRLTVMYACVAFTAIAHGRGNGAIGAIWRPVRVDGRLYPDNDSPRLAA